MLRRFSVNYAIFSLLVDAAIIITMLQVSTALRPLLNSWRLFAYMPPPVRLPDVLYLVFPMLWVAILASFALYDGKRHIRAIDEFTVLALASLLAAVALAGILYLSYREVSRAQYLLFVGLTCSALFGWRIVGRIAFRLRRVHPPQVPRRIIIVGSGPLGRMIWSRLTAEADVNLAVVGFVDEAAADGFEGKLLGSMSSLPSIVDATQASDVIVALPPHFYDDIHRAVASLNEKALRVWIALGFYDLALYRTATEDLAGVPLLDLRASALDDYERLVKRAFDLLLGAIAFVLLSPVLAAAAAAILLEDGRPVVFRQWRVGENGRLFQMLKLRSMVVNAEEGPAKPAEIGHQVHKHKRDPRVTSVGRVLRRLSIDEIPQLVNVLRGDMSLVGPRPELPGLVEQYEPWQRQRFAVPPGMTGWWQVTGRSEKAMHLHTEDDMYYVRNYSIWLDLQILVRTFWVVLLGRGAF